MRKISEEGKKLIVFYESCSLVPYLCPAGKWTISWGLTFYPNGKKVTKYDKKITQEEADQMFLQVLAEFESYVDKAVTVEIEQNEFDALVSLCYNIGRGNFGSSTLLRQLNACVDPEVVANHFDRWIYSKGKILNGLRKRRAAEKALFLR